MYLSRDLISSALSIYLSIKSSMVALITKSSPINVEKTSTKNVQKSTETRTKNGPRGLPGASPGPPRGLPEASLGPPGAILEDVQRNAKKQEKQKGSPDPIFQKNVKFTDPGWTPKSSRSGPESEKKSGKRYFFLMPRWGGDRFRRFVLSIFHRFFVFFRCAFSRIRSTVSKNGKLLETL